MTYCCIFQCNLTYRLNEVNMTHLKTPVKLRNLSVVCLLAWASAFMSSTAYS